jgi:hypothetical protein
MGHGNDTCDGMAVGRCAHGQHGLWDGLDGPGVKAEGPRVLATFWRGENASPEHPGGPVGDVPHGGSTLSGVAASIQGDTGASGGPVVASGVAHAAGGRQGYG